MEDKTMLKVVMLKNNSEKTKTLHAYHIAPMDFGWSRLPTIKQAMQTMLENCDDSMHCCGEGDPSTIIELLQFYRRAMAFAKEIGWEGDFRPGNEPRVALIPDECEPATVLVWKQDNNGSTFVVSTIPLPHLKSLYP
jgi:hypothetical protein